jgi:hypothetical protein
MAPTIGFTGGCPHGNVAWRGPNKGELVDEDRDSESAVILNVSPKAGGVREGGAKTGQGREAKQVVWGWGAKREQGREAEQMVWEWGSQERARDGGFLSGLEGVTMREQGREDKQVVWGWGSQEGARDGGVVSGLGGVSQEGAREGGQASNVGMGKPRGSKGGRTRKWHGEQIAKREQGREEKQVAWGWGSQEGAREWGRRSGAGRVMAAGP